jgi:hypothetical protein
MSLRIRTTIDGKHKFLDIYEDEPVVMELSFAEIQDITQKNSAFSQSFRLPGSKNNNEIFNYYYNVSAFPLDFNPNNKFETILTWDGYEILQGNIRLNSVTIDRDEVVYNVTFYNQVGDLAANIGDKFLAQTDLTSLNHPFLDTTIQYSQLDPNLFPLTGTTNYSFENGKTMWGLYNIGYTYISGNSVNTAVSPLVQFTPITGITYTPTKGFFDNPQTPVHDYYFKPTLQIKELYTLICEQAGYKIKSNFFDTDYFKRFYMPLKFADETIYQKNAISPCYTYYNQQLSFLDPFIPQFTNPSFEILCNNFSWTSNSKQFNVPQFNAGLYTFKFDYTLDATQYNNQITFTNPSCFSNCDYYYTDLNGNPQSGIINSFDCANPVNVLGYNPYGTCNFFQTFAPYGELWFSGASGNLEQLRADYNFLNTKVTISFERQFQITGNSNIGFYFIGDDCDVLDFTFSIVSAPPAIISGATVDYQLEFPPNDYKQIDFITSINRYFNLVMVPDPDYPRQMIVEPIVDYIGKGEVLDWTTKIDHSQPITLQPTTSLVNGTLVFNFQLDQDYANQNFKSASNRIFGTERKNLGLEYKNSPTTFESMFSSPMDITINSAFSNMLTLPSFSKVSTKDVAGVNIQNFLPFKILPRLVFRGPVLPTDNYGFVGTSGGTPYQYWYMESLGTTYTEDRFQELNRFSTYPFNYYGFSHYCNFRGEDTTAIQPPEFQFVAEDLYDVYYKDYIDDLISPESKIYQGKIYLYPEEIKALRFDEKILIDNNYFRINKISNFNMLEPGICDIELIKLTKEYRGHRILYYDLIDCASGTTLHSNSDLNYNLYAYANNFVRLHDDDLNYLGCYEVVVSDFNPSYNYEHYYIASGYTSQLVGIYSDCGCNTRVPMDLVQQTGPPVPSSPPLSPTPTPSITPSHTITPTPTLTPGLSPSQTPTPEPTPSITPSPEPPVECFYYRNRSPFQEWYGDYITCSGEYVFGAIIEVEEQVCLQSYTTISGPLLTKGPSCIT